MRRPSPISFSATLLGVLSLTSCGGAKREAPAHARASTVVVPEAPAQSTSEPEPPAAERESGDRALPSGLRIQELRPGTGAVAEPGRRVVVHYVGTLVDGTVFDSSRERSPFVVDLGKGWVIKGWEEGLVGMRVGGIRKLIIPPDLAYGERATASIPASSTLVFEIELLDVQ